jgi:hypothetical protein
MNLIHDQIADSIGSMCASVYKQVRSQTNESVKSIADSIIHIIWEQASPIRTSVAAYVQKKLKTDFWTELVRNHTGEVCRIS